jgi:SAM-dependent methyltransferase
MPLTTDEREWDELAGRDPLWAVLSCVEPGAWDVAAFFESGGTEVCALLDGLEREGLAPALGVALDFGCGVGRLTRALATRFDAAVGVDISSQMVEQAHRLNANAPACSFVHNPRADLRIFGDGAFDFVLSLIVLQHVSSTRAVRNYISEFVRITAAGGVIVFQLPTNVPLRVRLHPLRALNRLARHGPWLPQWLGGRLLRYSMVLRGLPEGQVRAVIEEAGAELVTVFPDKRAGSDLVPSLLYVARIPTS